MCECKFDSIVLQEFMFVGAGTCTQSNCTCTMERQVNLHPGALLRRGPLLGARSYHLA